MEFMAELDQKKAELFTKNLNTVNSNFQRIFSELSTKGEAELYLEKPESVFDGGLRIKVRLSGEKFLDIRSLSGGEKTMTALAFLFAIQDHEPASFYILDEVDAAIYHYRVTSTNIQAALLPKRCDCRLCRQLPIIVLLGRKL